MNDNETCVCGHHRSAHRAPTFACFHVGDNRTVCGCPGFESKEYFPKMLAAEATASMETSKKAGG